MSETVATVVAPTTRRGPVSELFFGFPVMATATIGCGLGINGLATYPLPYFMPAFQKAFGWDRASVGFAITFITGTLFFVAPFAGRLCDKFGARKMAIISILLFALGYCLLSLVGGSIWTLYAGYALLAVLGIGTLSITYSRAINSWFDHNRGFALGVMTAGTGCTAFALPLILPRIIEKYGWQAGFLSLGGIALLALPFVLLFLKERTVVDTLQESPKFGLSFPKIRGSYQFWLMLVGLLLVTTAVSGATLHFVPMFTDLGGDPRAMQKAASLYGLTLIGGRLIAGFLLDRLPGRLIAIVLFGVPGLATFLPGFLGPQVAPLFAIAMGLALAAETDLAAYLCSRYFGLKAFSQAYGWIYAAGALGFAVGPLVAGWGYKTYGDYNIVRLVWAGLFLGAAALFALLGRYPTAEELELRETAK